MPYTNTKTCAGPKSPATKSRWPFSPSLLGCAKAMVVLTTLFAPLAIIPAEAEDLATYAEKCNKAVGIEVKSFNCTQGAEIPMDGDAGGNCKKPPYLHFTECRAGSHFGVQETENKDIAIVWLCRKKQVTIPNNDEFDDIAVIQTNFKNGATCFYQHLGKIKVDNVPAPDGDTQNFWMSPQKAAEQECASCHDTGLLRTPYLTQLTVPPNVVPKKRYTDKYWFPGEDFAGWNGKVYKLSGDATKSCSNSCHVMGANTIDPNVGTSAWLAPLATGVTETKNLTPFSTYGQHAFWMRLNLSAPDANSKAAAELISKCAKGEAVDNCIREPWGGQTEAVIESMKGRKPPELKQPHGDYDK